MDDKREQFYRSRHPFSGESSNVLLVIHSSIRLHWSLLLCRHERNNPQVSGRRGRNSMATLKGASLRGAITFGVDCIAGWYPLGVFSPRVLGCVSLPGNDTLKVPALIGPVPLLPVLASLFSPPSTISQPRLCLLSTIKTTSLPLFVPDSNPPPTTLHENWKSATFFRAKIELEYSILSHLGFNGMFPVLIARLSPLPPILVSIYYTFLLYSVFFRISPSGSWNFKIFGIVLEVKDDY